MLKDCMLRTVLFLLLAIEGCGGAKFTPGKTWDQNEEPFFDDGIDVVEDYSKLFGAWAFDQKNYLDARINLSDFIAIVKVDSVQTVQEIFDTAAKCIDAHVVEKLYGESPVDDVQLFSAKESPGYPLVLRYEHRLKGRFLVFVRWFNDKDGKVKHHFHLSSAADKLVEEVRTRVRLRVKEEAERKPN